MIEIREDSPSVVELYTEAVTPIQVIEKFGELLNWKDYFEGRNEFIEEMDLGKIYPDENCKAYVVIHHHFWILPVDSSIKVELDTIFVDGERRN
jgi:hypothetical protein